MDKRLMVYLPTSQAYLLKQIQIRAMCEQYIKTNISLQHRNNKQKQVEQ